MATLVKINREGLLALQESLKKEGLVLMVEDYNYYVRLDVNLQEKIERKEPWFDVTKADVCLAEGKILPSIGSEEFCPKCGHTPWDSKNPRSHKMGDAYDPFTIYTICYRK